MRPPVILIGMHRSGTTLVVSLLRRLDFFAGARLEENGEPWFFLRRNEWLLRRAGGAWDRPTPVKALLGDPVFRAEVNRLFSRDVASRAFAEFAGGRARLDDPWGWKDPRNVFTLDVWRSIFPGARLLYVRRHGVDVAASLVARHRRIRDSGDSVLTRWSLSSRLKAALSPLEFQNHFSLSARCTTLDGAFELWEEYAGEAEAVFAAFDGDKLAVDFENLSRDPKAHARAIATFCGCAVDDGAIDEVASSIDASKALGFARDPTLVRFHERIHERPLMRALGYDASPEADE